MKVGFEKRAKNSRTMDQLEQLINEVFDQVVDIEDGLKEIDQEQDIALERVVYEFDVKKEPQLAKRDALFEQIPQFWPIAMHFHTVMDGVLTDADEDLLDHLVGISVTRPELDKDNENIEVYQTFKLTFKFSENEYLKNTEVSKMIVI